MFEVREMLAFANARLDEAERVAEGLFNACRDPAKRPDFTACGGPAAQLYWEHFTPAAMLAEIEATRKAIALSFEDERFIDFESGCCHSAGEIADGQCPESGGTLRVIVDRWNRHPGYRNNWKGPA